MYRSPWFVTHSTRPLKWRFLRGPLRSVLIWRRVDTCGSFQMAFWSHHEQSILSFLQIPATVWSAWLFYCSKVDVFMVAFQMSVDVSWVGSWMFENGHPHWLLEASFAAWLLWLASFALCSSRHRQPGAASMTSVMNIAVEESPLQHGEHGAILVILPRKCGQNSHWNRWKWTSILVRPWIILDSGPVFRCNNQLIIVWDDDANLQPLAWFNRCMLQVA